jgi:hypothetical protein
MFSPTFFIKGKIFRGILKIMQGVNAIKIRVKLKE